MSGEPLLLFVFFGFLVFVRIASALRLTPFLGGEPVAVFVCIGLSAALALLITPIVIDQPAGDIPHFGSLIMMILSEGIIGVCFGLMAKVVFSVFEMIGNLVQVSGVPFPGTGESDKGRGAPYAQVYIFLGIGVFLLIGGHHGVFSVLVGSFKSLPVSSLMVNTNNLDVLSRVAEVMIKLFASAFGWAVMLAAPVFVAGLAAQMFVAIIGRIIPEYGFDGDFGLFRVLFVNFVVIFILGVSISAGVSFLTKSIEKMAAF